MATTTTQTQQQSSSSWLNTLLGGNVLGNEGVNFTISFAMADLMILIGGVFGAVTIGVILARVITPGK